MPTPPPSDLQDKLESLIESDAASGGKIRDLMKLLEKARQTKEGAEVVSDSDEGEEDCRELMSLCCAAPLRTIFGTLPIRARCTDCGKEQRLSEIVEALSAS